MAESVITKGFYDPHQKTENDALSCSLVNLQETYQCILDHIDVEEQSLQKEMKQFRSLESRVE